MLTFYNWRLNRSSIYVRILGVCRMPDGRMFHDHRLNVGTIKLAADGKLYGYAKGDVVCTTPLAELRLVPLDLAEAANG